MHTAIIIATSRRPDLAQRVLRNLAACPLPPDVEVLVVENGPPCGVDAIVATDGPADRSRYLYRPVGNKSLALNHALSQTTAEFVIFLDDDVTIPPELVATYIEAAQRHRAGRFFGGGLSPEQETDCPPHLAPYLPRSVRGWRYSELEAEIPASDFDFFFGANWAAFRQDLLRAGLFRADLGITGSEFSPVGEETELQARLVGLGLRPIFLPKATILHPVPREHHTVRWLAHRRFRLGAAEWSVSHGRRPHRSVAGLPLWALRCLAQRGLHAISAAARGASVETRTEARMEIAHLTGLLWGAWMARPRPGSRDAGPDGRRPAQTQEFVAYGPD